MKKLVSLLTVIFMLLSVFSVAVSASEADYVISNGEVLTVSIPEYGCKTVEFTPEEDCALVLTSYAASEHIDPYCELLDADGEVCKKSDDYKGYDFALKYSFTAGETYTFIIGLYGTDAAEFDIAFECAHSYKDGVCALCGEECDHEIVCFESCACGEVFNGTILEVGDEVVMEYTYQDLYYRFVPDASGIYSFYSMIGASEEGDLQCYLYDSEGQWIKEHDDISDDNYNFNLFYYFEEGEVYYFEVYSYNENVSHTLRLDFVQHTVEGEVHEVEYVEGVSPTCIEEGYTDSVYCHTCEEYILGHESLGFWIHEDDDWDALCDVCGAEIDYGSNCEHICHSDNWILSRIWKIILFFQRLFNINPYCTCGAVHW